MNATSIEWTDSTWNPVTGCSKVSPGCKHCYAETIANRFWKDRKFTDVRCHEDRLEAPLHWKKPRRIFVNSMSDLFHEDVPDEFIDKVFAVMALCPQHTFQVLTKRPERMAAYLCSHDVGLRWAHVVFNDHGMQQITSGVAVGWTRNGLPNVWLGVSVEDQQRADERIPMLLQTPAAVRFLSCEPLLSRLELPWIWKDEHCQIHDRPRRIDDQLCAKVGIDLVIVGGESGPGARPCNIAWIRSIVKQCKAAGVACFVKQIGREIEIRNDSFSEWPKEGDNLLDPYENQPRYQGEPCIVRTNNSKGGDPSEWPEDLRVRQMPDLVAQE